MNVTTPQNSWPKLFPELGSIQCTKKASLFALSSNFIPFVVELPDGCELKLVWAPRDHYQPPDECISELGNLAQRGSLNKHQRSASTIGLLSIINLPHSIAWEGIFYKFMFCCRFYPLHTTSSHFGALLFERLERRVSRQAFLDCC